ncbi:hypothetical protein OKW34_003724 [Paraburkholderia youngii]
MSDLSLLALVDSFNMHTQSRLLPAAVVVALAGAMSACSTPKPLYQQEQFDSADSPYMHKFEATADSTCEAARRALLSQGYIASPSKSDSVDGSKNFQPSNDSHAVIEVHVVCTADDPKSSHSTAYVNAVQDRYALKKSNTSASVGLSVFGSLSLPIGSSDDSMVKVASETIPAGVFYQRYFALVQHYLKVDAVQPDPAVATTPAAAARPAAATTMAAAPGQPQALSPITDALPPIGASAAAGNPQNAANVK